jgi:hypothetical protein
MESGQYTVIVDRAAAMHISRGVIGGRSERDRTEGLAVMLLHLRPGMKETAMTDKRATIWRTILIVGMILGLGGIIGEMVWSADKEKLKEIEVVAMAASAKVTIEGAVGTALGSIAGQVIEAELERRGDKAVWNVEILTEEEGIMAVYVDAVSGAVVMTEEKVVGKRLAQDKLS